MIMKSASIQLVLFVSILNLSLQAQIPVFNWMHGSQLADQAGIYGIKGQPNIDNTPGSRWESIGWKDDVGNLWLFGGGNAQNDFRNDLWKYDITTNEWSWINGSKEENQIGSYGTLGVTSPSNNPGSRERSCSWTDSLGNFWLFGGIAKDSLSTNKLCNDLWKYTPEIDQWTWMGGSNESQQPGNYGIKGESNLSNIPGARSDAIIWTDPDGNLWLFGGVGLDTNGDLGLLNDLWKYNFVTGLWTWVNGGNTVGSFGNYGILGEGEISNIPAATSGAVSWVDKLGNLWLFGGSHPFRSLTQAYGASSDLWKLEPDRGIWTWMGKYQGGEDSSMPIGRVHAISWTDQSGNLWLFGGDDRGYKGGVRHDLWKYEIESKEWKWMAGEKGYYDGVYGDLGSGGQFTRAGARMGAVSWTDDIGNLWLFSGLGYGVRYNNRVEYGTLNDLWKISFDPLPEEIWTYPNPTADFIKIKLPDVSELSGWEISDMTGRNFQLPSIYKLSDNELEIQFDQLPSGIYLVKLVYISSKFRVIRVLKY